MNRVRKVRGRQSNYGPPRVGDLDPAEKPHVNGNKPAVSEQVTSKFTLFIRAETNVGIQVSLSGLQ
jgi:hypothetical protein